jgi:hypothetical protein
LLPGTQYNTIAAVSISISCQRPDFSDRFIYDSPWSFLIRSRWRDTGSSSRRIPTTPGSGYLPYEQHFGLGKVERVDGLEILWPSGLKQDLENLPINTTIRVREGKDGWEEVYRKKAEVPAEADSAPAARNPEDRGGRA